ncbi:MAG: S8 family peptidase [Theionarchaea archaeon]|nr:S8 family peptidase [Theionarchaea archaeon]
MKRIVAGVLVVSLLVSLYSVWAPPTEQVIVVFNNTPDSHLVGQYGQVHRVFHIIPAVVATLPQPAIEALSHNPNVKYIQPDYIRVYVEPMQYSGEPEPLAQVLGGFNAIAPKGRYRDPDDFNDDHGHGTHCAGIAAAVDNDIGVVGVAPEAWLYGVKVLSKTGSGQTSDCIEGIQWCADNGMDVISMSWGSTTYDQALNDTCAAAWAAGCVLVASAGNSGVEDPDGYPSAYPSVISVSATDSSDQPASFTNYGDEIELAAPGVSIYSCYNNGGYVTMSGTSMSCPHVSGAAALAIAAHPTYTNQQIRQLLWDTAEDLGDPGWDPYYGYGLVDAEAAVI